MFFDGVVAAVAECIYAGKHIAWPSMLHSSMGSYGTMHLMHGDILLLHHARGEWLYRHRHRHTCRMSYKRYRDMNRSRGGDGRFAEHFKFIRSRAATCPS